MNSSIFINTVISTEKNGGNMKMKMNRSIIKIDEEKCTGCAECIPNCPEGAIQIIDSKARLVSDLMCDGLGACLGHCPEGAITIEEREAEAYDEKKVMKNIVKAGTNTIAAHLKHLKDHNQIDFLNQALEYLKENNLQVPSYKEPDLDVNQSFTCPGSRVIEFSEKNSPENQQKDQKSSESRSALTHWPIQMHLLSPNAPHYKNSDMILAADCTAFSLGNFHNRILRDKTLGIACPKLDEGKEIYKEKIRVLIDDAHINTLTVVTMQVPCCSGLLFLAQKALSEAKRKIPVKSIVLSLRGEIIKEEWI